MKPEHLWKRTQGGDWECKCCRAWKTGSMQKPPGFCSTREHYESQLDDNGQWAGDLNVERHPTPFGTFGFYMEVGGLKFHLHDVPAKLLEGKDSETKWRRFATSKLIDSGMIRDFYSRKGMLSPAERERQIEQALGRAHPFWTHVGGSPWNETKSGKKFLCFKWETKTWKEGTVTFKGFKIWENGEIKWVNADYAHKWMEDINNRRVALSEHGPYTISTVFIPFHFDEYHFETMVFEKTKNTRDDGLGASVYEEREDTIRAAKVMHSEVLELVKKYHAIEDPSQTLSEFIDEEAACIPSS